MDKLAVYEALLENHPLWTKEGGFAGAQIWKTVPRGPGPKLPQNPGPDRRRMADHMTKLREQIRGAQGQTPGPSRKASSVARTFMGSKGG